MAAAGDVGDPRASRSTYCATPLSAALLGDQLDARREQFRTTLPVRRVVGPADIAALAVHLMTNTATRERGIDYPVAVDNDYEISRAPSTTTTGRRSTTKRGHVQTVKHGHLGVPVIRQEWPKVEILGCFGDQGRYGGVVAGR
ncbi:hypothetical protein [Pseudonocardia sp.]|uniref:hypothetical protein n=1 Tax=Pseudonocardia sp. TaxID=60912 RepID=UPI0031FBB230